jgi:hypothetical protein
MKRASNEHRVMKRRTLFGAASGLALSAPAIRAQAQAGAGVALVIGNSKYQWEAPLPNVRRDAPDIAKRFQAMGLRTDLVQDAGRDTMRSAIDKFAASARGANFAAFYFAGHGATWGKDTYLAPVDADLATPDAVQKLVPVPSTADAAAGAANRLLIFDNCRNNPADGWRQLEAKRSAYVSDAASARIVLQPNALVLYSTASGRVALDGPAGENSPFAAALLRQLDGQSVDLRTLAPLLRRDLLIATEGRQVLWDANGYQQSFVLKGARGQSAANKVGWARDPSRIVELTNAYAHAREIDTPLPEGLIAHRPASNSRDGQKVGSFKFVVNGRMGRFPMILIVMSVDDGRSAEIILAGATEKGKFWNFITGDLTRDRLEFQPLYGYPHFSFVWTDASSGNMSLVDAQQTTRSGGTAFGTTKFTRLDG